MPKKLADILEEKGMPIDFQYGGSAPEEMVDREVQKEPDPRPKKLLDLYFDTLSSATVEFPYWYTRKWKELDGDVPVIRRATALKYAFSHVTPTIFPGEKLVMGRARYYRGSFPMPWESEGYFMSKEDELYQDALKKGSVSSGEVSVRSRRRHMLLSFGNVVSIAGKFGMRQEEEFLP